MVWLSRLLLLWFVFSLSVYSRVNKMKQFNTTTFSSLYNIAQVIQFGSTESVLDEIDSLIAIKRDEHKSGWINALSDLRAVILTGEARWNIFKLDGNSKLPFVAFSSLPGVTCPGAGECLNWCYSFRSWRYPAAFCRQAQNAWMMRYFRGGIEAAFYALPESIKLRLYVDGDFANNVDVNFWFHLLSERPDIRAYGYSKSFFEILSFKGTMPNNYLLNLSGGHNHSAATVSKMESLPITRGTFSAVSIGRKVKATDHGSAATNKALFKIAGKGIFPCPGKCGDCRKGEHACGSEKLRGIPIVIAVH